MQYQNKSDKLNNGVHKEAKKLTQFQECMKFAEQAIDEKRKIFKGNIKLKISTTNCRNDQKQAQIKDKNEKKIEKHNQKDSEKNEAYYKKKPQLNWSMQENGLKIESSVKQIFEYHMTCKFSAKE